MFRFTIRDVLWLMVVVGLVVGFTLQSRRAHDLELDRTLWKTRAMQLKSQAELDGDVTIEFLPTKTNVHYGTRQEVTTKDTNDTKLRN